MYKTILLLLVVTAMLFAALPVGASSIDSDDWILDFYYEVDLKSGVHPTYGLPGSNSPQDSAEWVSGHLFLDAQSDFGGQKWVRIKDDLSLHPHPLEQERWIPIQAISSEDLQDIVWGELSVVERSNIKSGSTLRRTDEDFLWTLSPGEQLVLRESLHEYPLLETFIWLPEDRDDLRMEIEDGYENCVFEQAGDTHEIIEPVAVGPGRIRAMDGACALATDGEEVELQAKVIEFSIEFQPGVPPPPADIPDSVTVSLGEQMFFDNPGGNWAFAGSDSANIEYYTIYNGQYWYRVETEASSILYGADEYWIPASAITDAEVDHSALGYVEMSPLGGRRIVVTFYETVTEDNWLHKQAYLHDSLYPSQEIIWFYSDPERTDMVIEPMSQAAVCEYESFPTHITIKKGDCKITTSDDPFTVRIDRIVFVP